jgi:hypothetical protein
LPSPEAEITVSAWRSDARAEHVGLIIVGWLGQEFPSRLEKIEVLENGPVHAVLRIERDYLKPGTVKEFPTEDGSTPRRTE